jgi:hypothetical protein
MAESPNKLLFIIDYWSYKDKFYLIYQYINLEKNIDIVYLFETKTEKSTC